MKTSNYKFLNLHLSLWIRYFIAALLGGLFILSIAGMSLWIIPCILIVVVLCVFLLTLTTISMNYGIKNSKIVIKGAMESISMETPIKADVWWNYSFNTKFADGVDGTIPLPARSDEINVMLEIQDRTGQRITFVERIVFDFRFPNEADYSLETIDESSAQFKVQRVDKLIDFLGDYIVEKF